MVTESVRSRWRARIKRYTVIIEVQKYLISNFLSLSEKYKPFDLFPSLNIFKFRKKVFFCLKFNELTNGMLIFLKACSVQKRPHKTISPSAFLLEMTKLCDTECNVSRRKINVIKIFFYVLKSETLLLLAIDEN